MMGGRRVRNAGRPGSSAQGKRLDPILLQNCFRSVEEGSAQAAMMVGLRHFHCGHRLSVPHRLDNGKFPVDGKVADVIFALSR